MAAGEHGCAGLQGLDRFGKELLAARNPFAAGAARRPTPLAVLFHSAGSPTSPASPGAQAPPPMCALHAGHGGCSWHQALGMQQSVELLCLAIKALAQ